MISPTKPLSRTPKPKQRFRLLSSLWTSVCVVCVISLSMMLYVSQQRNNDSLPAALDAQVSELLGEVK